MKLRSRRSAKTARIEIVPLIDIMFFLLATFVMVSTSMINNRAIPVELPKASSGSAQSREKFVTLSVSESGSYYLDKKRVDSAALASELGSLRAQNPEVQIFINGDKSAELGALVTALDQVRLSGITRVALETSALGAEGQVKQ